MVGSHWRANPEPGGGERRKVFAVWDWFAGCCDAGDVIDDHECIISIRRGSGGNLNRLLPGWEKGKCVSARGFRPLPSQVYIYIHISSERFRLVRRAMSDCDSEDSRTSEDGKHHASNVHARPRVQGCEGAG